MVQSVIAAGGAGTRLRRVTGSIPKVLAPVRGEPFLGHVINRLTERGATCVHLLLGVGAEQVCDWLSTARLPVTVTYTVEDRPLGVIGALRHATCSLKERFVFTYGDVYPLEDVPLRKVMAAGERTILGVIEGTDDERPNLTVDDGRVIAYGRDPGAHALDAGMLSLTRADVVDLVPKNERYPEEPFYRDLIGRGLFLRVQDLPTVHIGDPAAYARTCRILGEHLAVTRQGKPSHQH